MSDHGNKLIEVAAEPALYQQYRGESKFDYGYEKEPYLDVSVIGQCDWLPAYLREAWWRADMHWTHAMCWAEMLQRKAGGYAPKNRTENKQVREVIEIAMWTRYWAYEGFGIRRRQERDPKFVEANDE